MHEPDHPSVKEEGRKQGKELPEKREFELERKEVNKRLGDGVRIGRKEVNKRSGDGVRIGTKGSK